MRVVVRIVEMYCGIGLGRSWVVLLVLEVYSLRVWRRVVVFFSFYWDSRNSCRVFEVWLSSFFIGSLVWMFIR